MPIKVFWVEDGPFALCDSPAEAAELLRLVEPAPTEATANLRRQTAAQAPLSEEQSMARFLAELKPNQKTFLSVLSNYEDGIVGEHISKETGLEAVQFGAIAGAISKNAKRNRIKIGQLLLSETRFEGPRRFRFFQPKPLLLKYASQLLEEQIKLSA
jgi:hypothetical protein